LIDARDIGVSYFVVGIVGVLTYRIARPWRWVYLGTALVGFGAVLAVKHDFTNVGHVCALLIGLACFPLTRSRRMVPAAA
jgi:drug/metabolite transporter (DMT)-like permease